MATKEKTVKDTQQELIDSAHKIWLAGLGALALAEEEGTRAFKKLVERGESFESRGKESVSKVVSSVEKAAQSAKDRVGDAFGRLEGSFDAKVASTLERLGVPTRDEIKTLTKRVEELTKSVEKLRVN